MKLEYLLNQSYDRMNESEREITRYILENRAACARASIGETADACHVSRTVLVRYAKKLGLPGYRELKAMLKLEYREPAQDAGALLDELTGNYHKMLEDFRNRDFGNLCEQIRAADRILVYGSGYAQARVASEFKRIFLPSGKTIFHVHGNDMVEALADMAEGNDLVFIISLSGESEAVLGLARKLRLKGISLVSITHMQSNRLASICGENLYINSMSLTGKTGAAYEVSTPYFILIELLFLRYQLYMQSEQSF